MHRAMCRATSLIVAAALTIAGSGCQPRSVAEPEHHVPEHRPADFHAAVVRLDQLHREIVAGPMRPDAQLDVFSELRDVVRWLPELAADSDLAERPWLVVAEVSKDFEGRLTSVLAAPPGERSSRYRELAPEWLRMHGELARVAGSARTQHQAHDHSHDHTEEQNEQPERSEVQS